MFSFSKLRYIVVGMVLLTAACGTDPKAARAQDLSIQFHAGAGRVETRPQVATRPNRTFSMDDPARILVIGDSLAQGFGIFLDRRVKERNLAAVVTNRGRTSTGLSRSDFYDWPANFEQQAEAFRPDIVVAHFGANDNQTIIRSSGRVGSGTEAWDAAYRDQTRRILDIAARYQAVVYWLGPAPDRGGNLNRHLTHINPIFQQEAAAVQANYLPLSEFAAGANGEYVKNAPVNGRVVTIRSGDGSHFTSAGYYFVVDQVLAAMERQVPSIFAEPKLELAGILQ
jgi:hypothetical protein